MGLMCVNFVSLTQGAIILKQMYKWIQAGLLPHAC